MPKIGMEPVRRKALIHATIEEIGLVGSLDVTVSQIARRAGMSSALAHHYFGSKDQILIAAMRHIMSEFGRDVKGLLKNSETPTARIEAIVDASFGGAQFQPHVISAWLVFYVQAQTSPEAARLLRVYVHRLHTNLMHNLIQLTNRPHAERIAHALAALIDGFYIRHALQDDLPDRSKTKVILMEYLTLSLAHGGEQ